ncbi:hypothetical protein Tco_1163386 [Tanacetum coccineum]
MDFHNSKLHMASVEEEFSGMPAFNGFSHFDPHVVDESPYTMPSIRDDLSGITTFSGLSDFNPHIEKGRDGRRASHAFKEIWEVGTKRRQAAIAKQEKEDTQQFTATDGYNYNGGIDSASGSLI